MSSTSFTSQDDVATIPTNAGPQENEDLHCQIQQQQPHHACQRFNSASSTTSSHCSSNPRAPRRETADGLDEVGFGARIDKSVAAAGDLVTLDMFVVKSDLMKVVDIKVSLVETIQVFSLLDNGKPDDVTDDDPLTATKKPPRRKLVDTHVVKIAKDYVPPHSEENHANDNHLKGYYEDYEDFRTTKSLSVYKLALRLPEHALTLDLELLKTEYMFVIKFFFKGRMGAFLELPIEIVSQYNLNRISTISGAMSCISNSVQIALPPVPVLVQQDGGLTPESDVVADKDRQQLSSSPSLSTPPLESDHVNVGGNSVGIQSLDVQDDHAAPTPEVKTISQEGNQALDEETFAAVDQETVACHHSPIDMASGARVTAQEQIPVLIEGTLVTEKSPQNKSPPTAGDGTDDQEIVCSSRLSKTESEACRSNVARIAAALMAKDAGIEQKEQAAQVNPAKGIIPKIVVDNSKSNHTSKSSSSRLNFASRRESSSQDKESSLVSGALTSGPSSATSRPTRTTTAVSPALPILFDLTSAGLPSPSMHAPSPAAVQPDSDHSHSSSRSSSSSNSSNENRTTTAAKRSLKTSLLTPNAPGPGSIGYSRCTDMSDPSHKQQLLHVGPLGGLPSIVSNGCPSDDDGSLNGDVRPSQHHNGLVAKIAKSLSSPLLRTRNNNGNGSGGDNSSSPSGSSMNLALLAGSTVSPQQQSTAFTLAATTLTLLSSVGQVAGVGGVVTSGGMILQDGNIDRQYQQHLHPRRSSQPVLSSRPLKSCLKKRRNSVPPSLVMSGLRPPPPMQGTAAAAAGGMSAKKKVTFAKGSTPLPSPNASQTFLPSLDHNGLVPPHRAIQCHPKQQQQQQQQQYLAPSFESPMTLASIPYSQPSAPSSSQVRFQHPISINPHQQQQQQQQRRATGTSQVYGPASTNSPSPRSRMYHPFDNHPSRLSPLEKQRLDFQLKVQNPVRGGHNEYPEHEKRQGGRAIVGDNDEDEEEEEDMLHEAQDREEDDDADNDDDDDRETEEERIERRRQARAAWLAKYGDAFKQVYGAVPELPPI
ncbi:hypothetical protein BGX31_011713 [Mortierella sp. GBA43]|nr:hypothetical protein BGX31_011713 [Mortierella sp. GBA43]